MEPDCKGALCDILWSDPLHEPEPMVMARPQVLGQEGKGEGGAGAGAEEDAMEEYLNVEFRLNFERGCSYYFGYRAIRRFLDDNGLLCLVRAHQVQEEGFRRHFDPLRLQHHHRRRRGSAGGSSSSTGGSPLIHGDARELLPPVITIFSAPNYAGRYGNKVLTYLSAPITDSRPARWAFVVLALIPVHLPLRPRPGRLPPRWAGARGHVLRAVRLRAGLAPALQPPLGGPRHVLGCVPNCLPVCLTI